MKTVEKGMRRRMTVPGINEGELCMVTATLSNGVDAYLAVMLVNATCPGKCLVVWYRVPDSSAGEDKVVTRSWYMPVVWYRLPASSAGKDCRCDFLAEVLVSPQVPTDVCTVYLAVVLVRTTGGDEVLIDVRRPGAVLFQVLLVLGDVLAPAAR